MAEDRLGINRKSVIALREFAEVMPIAAENIAQDTETLINVYSSVADKVGPHSDDFNEIIRFVKTAQENAAGAILEIPRGLNKTADDIEQFLARKINISGK